MTRNPLLPKPTLQVVPRRNIVKLFLRVRKGRQRILFLPPPLYILRLLSREGSGKLGLIPTTQLSRTPLRRMAGGRHNLDPARSRGPPGPTSIPLFITRNPLTLPRLTVNRTIPTPTTPRWIKTQNMPYKKSRPFP